MKPIKCEVCSKFYDGDKYETCPHCNGVPPLKKAPIKTVAQNHSDYPAEPAAVSQKNNSSADAVHTGQPKEVSIGGFFKRFMHDKPEEKEVVIETPVETGKSVKTTSMSNQGNRFVQPTSELAPQSNVTTAPASMPKTAGVQEEDKDTDMEEKPMNLAAAIQQADSAANSADTKTVAYYNFSNDIDPVVGWLICVAGEYKGESFSLGSGRNNIGRSMANKVALAKEKTVSREKHAAITFEPKKKKFFIQNGESSGLTYVNDELVMTFQDLADYDIITLGEAKFVFLRLVGDKFSWEKFED